MAVQALTRDSMPKGEGDLSIEGHGMEPIPEAARYGAVWRLFTVWFTPNLVPAAFAIGVLAPASFIGLGFVDGLLAIVVGNLIGAALVGVLSAMGPRTGMAQIPAARLPFGKSIVVPAVHQLVEHDRLGRHQRVLRRLCHRCHLRRRGAVPGRPAGRRPVPGRPERRGL